MASCDDDLDAVTAQSVTGVPVTRRHVQLLQSVEDVERLPPGPAVVLASLPSLEGGPARELLTRWATGERNLIVVPGRPLVHPVFAGSNWRPALQQLASLCSHLEENMHSRCADAPVAHYSCWAA